MGTIAQLFESGEQSADKGIFKNLVMLARVDGTVDDSEQALLERIAHRLSLTEEQVHEIQDHPGNYPMIPPVSKEERFERFVQFIEMVCIDGVVDPSEEKLANKYGVALGFNSEEISSIEQEIISKMKEGISSDEIVDSMI